MELLITHKETNWYLVRNLMNKYFTKKDSWYLVFFEKPNIYVFFW
jgi:hypothetical protein